MEDNIIEGNILIGEFDGKFDYERAFCKSHGLPDYNPHEDLAEIKTFKYHSSWDWLMPVVEKIATIKIKYSNDSDYYSPYPRTFGMQDEDGNFMVRLNVNVLFKAPTLIEATWLAVIEFIKWYL